MTVVFNRWLYAVEPGTKLEYHRGFLAIDREKMTKDQHNLCVDAYIAAERGIVHIVQKRHGPLDYSYIAVRR